MSRFKMGDHLISKDTKKIYIVTELYPGQFGYTFYRIESTTEFYGMDISSYVLHQQYALVTPTIEVLYAT